MKPIRILFILLFVITFQISAQEIEGFDEKRIASYKSKAEDQVRFLEYLLNTIGSEEASSRDKEVIITESYQKIFRDSKVQIEDDLIEERQVIINKDVTAYLKDIDFFFQNAQFDFDIQSIEAFLRDNGELSFKLELMRTLKASGVDGKSILNKKTRFIEINLDQENDELQIASIYSTKLSKDEAVKEWWASLSIEWKSIFKSEIALEADSLTIDQLNKIASIDSLSLSRYDSLVDIQPLSFLVDLEYIDLSQTKIKSLAPLSSLTELRFLNISETFVKDMKFLRYAENMEYLDISFTPVSEIYELENLESLRVLNLSGADITDFAVLKAFTNLRELDLSETFFNRPEVLSKLATLEVLNMSKSNLSKLTTQMSPNSLKELNISFAFISDLSPLQNYSKLEVLSINNTQVERLDAIKNLDNLKKIYADNTFISEEEISDFIDSNPKKLLVVNSEEISEWWDKLNKQWKAALEINMEGNVVDIPQKEGLTKLLLRDSLNLSNWQLEDLAPLQKFSRLRYLVISNNPIKSLQPIQGLNSLSVLEAEDIELQSIEPLLELKKLRELSLAHNQLSEDQFLRLSNLTALKNLDVDRTGIDKESVRQFFEQKAADCSVVYDVEGVIAWWSGLDEVWRDIFRLQFPISNRPTAKELHDLLAIKSLVVVNENIKSLKTLSQFINLEKVYLEKIGYIDLDNAVALKTVKHLSITKSPIANLAPLVGLDQLEELILDFTAVSDLKPLRELQSLRNLSLAGTRVKSLRGIEDLRGLKYLNISSTQVRWIGKLALLDNLQEFTCYNTRIFDFSLNKFKEEHPECNVRFY